MFSAGSVLLRRSLILPPMTCRPSNPARTITRNRSQAHPRPGDRPSAPSRLTWVNGQAMSERWVLVQPAPGMARVTGLVNAPIPVRVSRVDELVGVGVRRINVAGLTDEIERFASEQTDTIERLTPSMVRLSIAATSDALWAKDWTGAERLARRGRRWSPANLSLRVQLGQALHGLGRAGEATEQWRSAVDAARCVGRWSPLLWLLTARAFIEQGRHREANDLLDEICVRSDNDAVRRLRDAVARRLRQGGRQ